VTASTLAGETIRTCRALALCSEEAGVTTRTFLSAPVRDVFAQLTAWMSRLGMTTSVDMAGNLRGVYDAARPDAPRLYVGSHLDTVPGAGAFDGVLGVVLGIALIELLGGRLLPCAIEIVGFSEEEGVRFGVPFIGSRAFAGCLDRELLDRRDASGHSVAEALTAFGLDPLRLDEACAGGVARSGRGDAVPRSGPDASLGYLEFHIEQGPVLERDRLPIGIVDAIAGQTRAEVTFTGAAGHAGTTPMRDRRDALAAAAEWIVAVEALGHRTADLVATVGRIAASPGAGNVIAGRCASSLDVRHPDDAVRLGAVTRLSGIAQTIAARRRLDLAWETRLDQPAVAMDAQLTARLETAAAAAGIATRRITSGAGHDAMIVAGCMPAAMLFVRSPGGISHHPDESVLEEDVAAALRVGLAFLDALAET
jgi:allantoate deiminase